MKTIVITGITKGIGLAAARRFQAGGYRVLGCASTPSSVNAVLASDPGLEVIQADLSQAVETQQFADWVLNHTTEVDVLLNNAGRFLPGQVATESDETFDLLMELNVGSAYRLTKALLPRMIERKEGTIVNLCSTASLKGYPNGASYCISKFALYGLTKALREELKEQGIRVVAVSPGPVLTASWEGVPLPSDRFMPAEDVAELIWTACSVSNRTVVEDIVLRPQLGDNRMNELPIYTKSELALRNGQDREEIWVAYAGIIYDVTNSRLWRNGRHYEHWAGQDLTEELASKAPHDERVFAKWNPVGRLV